MNEGTVALVFPPLVETNFGSYFPSTAVLAAYLRRHGVVATQHDLNEEMALHLLDERLLRELASGRNPRGGPDDPTQSWAVSARWLLRERDRLFDANGRHAFGPGSRYGHLLHSVARPFLTDPDAEGLAGGDGGDRPVLDAYRSFYEGIDTAATLPETTRLVGISVPMGPQLVPALLLAEHIRARRPELRIVMGGPTFSLMAPTDVAALLETHAAIDAIVRFDGEVPLLQLARQALEGAWRPHSVANVSCGTERGIRHGALGVGPKLDELPFAHYDPAMLERLEDPVLGIVQARGCYWGRCDYCDFVELYDGSPRFRTRTADSFLAELEHQIETTGVRRFTFVTESIPPAFARRLCRALIERGLKLTWTSFAMVDRRFDLDLLRLMAQSGCEFVVVGMETTITRVLELVHKSADREENFRFVREAHEAGLNVHVNLIPDLPSTTYEEALQALHDAEELARWVDAYAVFPFEPTKSSNVGRDPRRFGLVSAQGAGAGGQAQFALNHLDSNDPAMTDEQRRDIHRRFKELTVRVNTRPFEGSGSDLLTELPDEHERVRVAVKDLDLLPAPDGRLICTNVRTHERLTLPAAAVRLLGFRLEGDAFSIASLAAEIGVERAAALADQLIRARMLTTAVPAGA